MFCVTVSQRSSISPFSLMLGGSRVPEFWPMKREHRLCVSSGKSQHALPTFLFSCHTNFGGYGCSQMWKELEWSDEWKCLLNKTKKQTFIVLSHGDFWVCYLSIAYLILTNTKHGKIIKFHLALKFYMFFCLFPSCLVLIYTCFCPSNSKEVPFKLICLCLCPSNYLCFWKWHLF